MQTFLKTLFVMILLAAPLVAGCSDNTKEQGLQLAPPQENSTMSSGHLLPCPARPNCVSSEAPNGSSHIAPLHFSGPACEAWLALQDILINMGGQIEKADDHFLHVTFQSRIFRFVDDLSCRLDHANNLIHIRSASRIGYSDFGVNRQRVERVRVTFDNLSQTASDR